MSRGGGLDQRTLLELWEGDLVILRVGLPPEVLERLQQRPLAAVGGGQQHLPGVQSEVVRTV